MKKKIALLAYLLISISILAQTPQKMSYQAIVRDASNVLIANKNIGVRISILQNSVSGLVAYAETHSVMTNSNGLVSLEIGGGTPLIGTFSSIPWQEGSFFIKTETDPTGGTLYTIVATSQILSVPYALYAGKSSNGWNLTGNSGISVGNNFIGTTDYTDLLFKVNNKKAGLINIDKFNTSFGYLSSFYNTSGTRNTAIGYEALFSNTTGSKNTSLGYAAMTYNTVGSSNTAIGNVALFKNVEGNHLVAIGDSALYNNIEEGNTAIGSNAMFENTTGKNNTSIGFEALKNNTNGRDNVAVGYLAMRNSTECYNNVAVGSKALFSNSTGDYNVANGYFALYNNTNGNYNIASGYQTLYNNTLGNSNIASGHFALLRNTIGSRNVAYGSASLGNNTTGNGNVAVGYAALYNNITQSNLVAIGDSALFSNNSTCNTAIGYKALLAANQWSNTAIGYSALKNLTSGFDNIAVGCDAGLNQTSGNNNIVIGKGVDLPNLSGSNQIKLGNSNVSYAGVQVAWTITSDKRWKDEIRDLPFGLNLVKKLIPVDYVRKNNKEKTRETGFIAQDVEDALNNVGYVNQGLLTQDSKGRLELRYNDFIPILTKAIQEQQLMIDKLQNYNEQQTKTNAELQKKINKLEELINSITEN